MKLSVLWTLMKRPGGKCSQVSATQFGGLYWKVDQLNLRTLLYQNNSQVVIKILKLAYFFRFFFIRKHEKKLILLAMLVRFQLETASKIVSTTYVSNMSEICWIVHECLHFKVKYHFKFTYIGTFPWFLKSYDVVNPKKVSVRLYQYKIRYILLEKVCKCYMYKQHKLTVYRYGGFSVTRFDYTGA